MDNSLKSVPILPSEITPQSMYLARRDFLKAAGLMAGGALLAACAPAPAAPAGETALPPADVKTDELGDPATPYEDITNYNNYYEFTVNKEGVAPLSKNFTSHPWTVEISGLVNYPKTYAVEDLLAGYPQAESIYRLRCVEAWSMVIPWTGFSLASLLKAAEPTSDAKYVRFETVYRPEEMKGQGSAFYPWPYQEGLRIDGARRRPRGAASRARAAGHAAGTPAHRRGHERACDPGHRPVWPAPACAGRRADPPGCSLEIRLQIHQSHRQNRIDDRPAPDIMEYGRAE